MTDITLLQEPPSGKPWERDWIRDWEPAPIDRDEYETLAEEEAALAANEAVLAARDVSNPDWPPETNPRRRWLR